MSRKLSSIHLYLIIMVITAYPSYICCQTKSYPIVQCVSKLEKATEECLQELHDAIKKPDSFRKSANKIVGDEAAKCCPIRSVPRCYREKIREDCGEEMEESISSVIRSATSIYNVECENYSSEVS